MKKAFVNKIELAAKPLGAFCQVAFTRAFAYGICISFAACAPGFEVRKRTGVIVEGATGVSSEAGVQSVVLSPADMTSVSPKAIANFVVRDGEREIAVDVPIASVADHVVPGVGHEVSDGRDYRIQATCTTIKCDDVAAVFFIAQAGGSNTTKAYYFSTWSDALRLERGPVSGFADASTALTQLKAQLQMSRDLGGLGGI